MPKKHPPVSNIQKDPPPIQTIKNGKCPSISGKSALTYQIGRNHENALFIRIIGNTGGGYFGKDWAAVEDIIIQLEQCPECITSMTIAGLFHRRSANNAGFALAVILAEGLIKPSEKKPRCFVAQDPKPFLDAMGKPTALRKQAPPKKKKPAPIPVVTDEPDETGMEPTS